MGLFDFFKGNKHNSTDTQTMSNGNTSQHSSGINMTKEEAVSRLNMRKDAMTKLCMTKTNLANVRARVAVVMDYSGSMEKLYKRGIVQDTVERLLPIALKFDDNATLDMWYFSNGFRRLPDVTEDNFYQYVDREIISKGYDMGGTKYAPVMEDIIDKYAKDEPLDYPSLVLFITDGDNEDKEKAEKVIKQASKYNIFWQFIGIGHADFEFLEHLDEMEGRFIDNANFFPIENIHETTDEQLYEKLLFEYPSWEEKARDKKLIK